MGAGGTLGSKRPQWDRKSWSVAPTCVYVCSLEARSVGETAGKLKQSEHTFL